MLWTVPQVQLSPPFGARTVTVGGGFKPGRPVSAAKVKSAALLFVSPHPTFRRISCPRPGAGASDINVLPGCQNSVPAPPVALNSTRSMISGEDANPVPPGLFHKSFRLSPVVTRFRAPGKSKYPSAPELIVPVRASVGPLKLFSVSFWRRYWEASTAAPVGLQM